MEGFHLLSFMAGMSIIPSIHVLWWIYKKLREEQLGRELTRAYQEQAEEEKEI